MSSLTIRDLPCSTELDHCTMSAVRGGFLGDAKVNVNLNVDQKIAQMQDIDVNVLNNNGMIGAGFEAPKLNLDVMQKANNSAFLPKFL
jgi:hypothetical protein